MIEILLIKIMSDTALSKNHPTNSDEKTQRKRKKPSRYGESASIESVHGSETEEDPYADDSQDDLSYSPPKQPKVIATIRNPSTTGKRQCTETDIARYGMTENAIDHNSFFDSITVPDATLVTTDTNSSDVNTRSECDFNQNDDAGSSSHDETQSTETLLKLLIAKVNALQEQMTRIEVKVDSMRDFNDKAPTGVLDMTKMLKAGLPAKDLNGLESLEKDLNDISKRTEIVSLIYEYLRD